MHYKRNLLIILLLVSTHGFTQNLNEPAHRRSSGGFWMGALAGPSLLLQKAPDSLIPEFQNYYNKLRSGWHYGFETGYFFNKHIGVGVKYSRFNTKQAVDSLVLELFSKIYYIDLSSNMSILSLSPMVYGRLPLLKDNLSITAGIGPAWLFYRNIGKAVNDSAMFKGSSPGLSASLRISYEILPYLGISLQGSYIHAFLKKYTMDDGNSQQVVELEKKDYQNISRLDYSLGIFYTFHRKTHPY